MRTGLVLDNCPIGQMPADSSYAKLQAMRAKAVGTLWTAGTHHTHEVYDRCEAILDHPFYILRVGGHRQIFNEWASDANDAMGQVPSRIRLQSRIVLTFGNEPNIEGWADDPVSYGLVYSAVSKLNAQIAFACPSFGKPGWQQYLAESIPKNRPGYVIINAYSHLIWEVASIIALFPKSKIIIGEVNNLDDYTQRPKWLQATFQVFANLGVDTSLVFIANGKSNGAWNEDYIITEQEAAQLPGEVQPQRIPTVDDKIRYYSQTWANERIKNNEDPRDTLAFIEHLKAIGADHTRPELFGLPFLVARPA